MTDAVRTTTLEEMVQRCAYRLGDWTGLSATQQASSVSEFIDYANLGSNFEDHGGRQLILTSGATDRGVVFIVTDSDQITHSLSVTPDFSVAPVAGTTAFMINLRGYGYRWSEYVRALNMAVDASYPTARTKVSASAVFDGETGLITLGTTLAEVYQVFHVDADGNTVPIAPARHFGYDGWWADRTNDRIQIFGQAYLDYLDGETVTVLGEGKHPAFTTWDSTTTLHPDWLEARACYHLALMGMSRDPTGNRARQVLTFQQEEQQKMALIRTYREPASALGRE